MKIQYKIIIAFLLILSICACSDFIELDAPQTQIVSQTVFENEASAASAIRGIYALMMTNTSFIKGSLEEYTGIASDELINYSTNVNRLQFYQNSLTAINDDVLTIFWGEAYKYIANANVILEGLEKSQAISSLTKAKLKGEALFIRSFCHYYLAVLFGDVPYLTTSGYEVNATQPRASFAEVISKIEADLLTAMPLLPQDFSASKGERIQPISDAAAALLARIYLYKGEWKKAEDMASTIIGKSNLYQLTTNLNGVFLANSMETIWQLKPVVPNTGTPQAPIFILNGAPNGISRRVSVTPELIIAFENNDQRKTAWIATFTNASGSWNYFNKYKSTTAPVEYSMIFRLAEQYLIRAEARVHMQDFEGARTDLNVIRNRAGLANTNVNDTESILQAVLQERRVELFGEVGHRWFDLKRMQKIDEVLSIVKPQWEATDALFPIPNAERLLNTNLSQNPGY